MSGTDLEEREQQTGSHDDLGIHPERREAEAAELEKLYNSSPDDTVGKGFSNEPSRTKTKFWTNRKKISGGLIGIGVGAVFGILSIIQGPFQIIHIAQRLTDFHFSINEDFSNRRTARLLRGLRHNDANLGSSRASTRLGAIGNKMADHYDAKFQRESGLKPAYDKTTGRLVGYQVVDSNRSIEFLGEAGFHDDADFAITQNSPGNIAGIDGDISPDQPFIDLRNENTRTRRKFAKVVTAGTGTNRVSSAIGSRLLIKRGAVDFHPFKNIRRTGEQKLVDYYRDVKQQRAERRRNGADPINRPLNFSDEDTDGDGEPDIDEAESNSRDQVQGELSDIADEAANSDGPEARNDLVRRILGRGAGGPALIGAAVCVANDIGHSIPAFREAGIILPMMRMGFEIIAAGNQVMSGRGLNIDELGATVSDFYDKENESAFVTAASYQYESGQDITGPDLPSHMSPASVEDKPELFESLNNVPLLSGACNFVEGIISKIPGVNSLVNIGSEVASGAIDGVLSQFGYSIEEFMNMVVGFFAGDVVDTYATGALLGNIVTYGSRLAAADAASALGGITVDASEEATLDEAANSTAQLELQQKSFFARYFDVYDHRSLAHMALISVPASSTKLASSLGSLPASLFGSLLPFNKVSAQEPYDYGFRAYGFHLSDQEAEKYADPHENELRLNEIMNNNRNDEIACEVKVDRGDYGPDATYHEFCEQLYKNGSPSSLRELNTGDSDYLPGGRQGDPSESTGEEGEWLANGKFCFQNGVDEGGNLVNGESVNFHENEKPEGKYQQNCTRRDMEWFMRYRFFLADTVTSHSLACYAEVEESCAQIGIGGQSAAAAPTDFPVGDENGYKGVDTSGSACPVGSEDLGTVLVPTAEDLPSSIEQTNIKLCKLPEIPSLNVAITKSTMDMIAAAKAEGVSLTGSSFRTTASQIELRRSHCGSSTEAIYFMSASDCSPPTAKPGTSMHEHGLAIDFQNCSSRATACYQWLAQNASNYGLQNLPSEPWHWSTTGN